MSFSLAQQQCRCYSCCNCFIARLCYVLFVQRTSAKPRSLLSSERGAGCLACQSVAREWNVLFPLVPTTTTTTTRHRHAVRLSQLKHLSASFALSRATSIAICVPTCLPKRCAALPSCIVGSQPTQPTAPGGALTFFLDFLAFST